MTTAKKVPGNYTIILELPIDLLDFKVIVADNIFIFRLNEIFYRNL